MLTRFPFTLFTRRADTDGTEQTFQQCVAAARAVDLYTTHAIPDTPEGRYEMLVLQVYARIRDGRALGAEGAAASQSLFDRLVEELEGTLREEGFQDKGFKKRMKKLVAATYDRFMRYDAALLSGPGALSAELAQIIWGAPAATPDSDRAVVRLFGAGHDSGAA